MTATGLIARREGWVAARVGENLIMMHAESTYYLNLTGSGPRIWELLESPRTVSELCEILSREFDTVPDAVRNEVLAFLNQLFVRKAISVHPPGLA